MQAMHRKVDEAKIGPGVELRDPVRLELLRRLQGLLGADHQVSRGAQAALLLCDIRYLEEHYQTLDNAVGTGKVTIQASVSSLPEVDKIVSKCPFEVPPFRVVFVSNISILLLAGCQKPDLSSTISSARARSLRRNNNPEPSPLQQAMPSTEPQAAQEQEDRLKRKQSAAWSASTGSSQSRSTPVGSEVSPHFHFLLIHS